MTTTFAPYDPVDLPAPVLAYLDARDDERFADAVALFAADATVLDDGGTYPGIDAIRAWVEQTSTEFTYTATRIGQRVEDGGDVVVQVRLDGTFPGGTVTLRYRFALDGERITRLAIAV
ncbi:nuclear transport factor 2 family protein [Serinibacter arcticus]|uniref:Nuclear transport factor 2 family protein n=1 Tax=Serinibacter arcticus TaxID=1655435 RepID=A0A2U1ZZX5_9MICO|nr:nuclear transport factor 2 family protein [Serinibacter arcticus]PWD52529.1 nuclear transport factor 2 family protein [Serinibacter arcticus]